jgi:CubicO group peptidase (beta-lactamase class C family)
LKGLRITLLVLLPIATVIVVLLGRGALQVAVGYSAKQLCSGTFVAGLPVTFIESTDVRTALAVTGPLLDYLQLDIDLGSGLVDARLLGVSARAVHQYGRGCSLGVDGPGDPPMPAAVAGEFGPGVPSRFEMAVDAAFEEPTGGGRNTLALLVAVDGELVVERYAAPVDVNTRMQGWSMNKSLMATWVGMQAGYGALVPASTVASSIDEATVAASIDARLTLLHLLQMESGLDFVEIYGPGSDVTRMLYGSEAMWTVPVGADQAYPPGSHFSYSSGDTVLATYLWQRSLGEPYEQWVEREFKTPLGISSLVAEADASGVQVGSSYAYMTGRDWLRAGQLWLDAWHGRSELLSREWLRESVLPRPSDPRGRYGRGFWLNTDGVAFSGLPASLFFARGHSGQLVIVVPEWELVLVRLALSESGAGSGVAELLERIQQQLEQAP